MCIPSSFIPPHLIISSLSLSNHRIQSSNPFTFICTRKTEKPTPNLNPNFNPYELLHAIIIHSFINPLNPPTIQPMIHPLSSHSNSNFKQFYIIMNFSTQTKTIIISTQSSSSSSSFVCSLLYLYIFLVEYVQPPLGCITLVSSSVFFSALFSFFFCSLSCTSLFLCFYNNNTICLTHIICK